jgi:xanthine dehydrogenase molybdenum-binding subunit
MKRTEKLNVVGKSIVPHDAIKKVTGKADYAADRVLPGMLYAKCLGSAYPHAKVKAIDISQAKALAGVVVVISCEDVSKTPFEGKDTRPYRVLTDHPICLGDEIAAVAATSPEVAEEAIGLIHVEYETLQAVLTPEEALAPYAPKLHDDGNVATPDGKPFVEEWGEPVKAFETASVVAEGRFSTGHQVHSAIEPRCTVADWDGDKLVVYTTSQAPHQVQKALAHVTSIPASRISVRQNFFGGGFGGKKVERHGVICSLLSKKAGKPVKLELTREEEFSVGRARYASTMDIKMAADKEGNITAIDFECFYDMGAYGNFIGGSLAFLLSQFLVYRFPNARFTAWDVNTNSMTCQPCRGVQMPGFHFGIEQVINKLARQLNMDPVEVRLKNTYRTGVETEPYKEILSSYAIEECIQKGKEIFGWDKKWKDWNPIKSTGKTRRGIGMATSIGWSEWARMNISVLVEIKIDGSALLHTGTTDLGTDSKTSLCQILAEELKLPLEKVEIVTGDTTVTPYDEGCFASRTLYLGGLSIQNAVREARSKLFEMASGKLQVDVSQLEFENGLVTVKESPETQMAITEFTHNSIFAQGFPPSVEMATPFRNKIYVGGAGVHLAEVEVDTETGEVRIEKYVAVHDVGRAINPEVVKNQIHGAILQGAGYALTEEHRFNPQENRYSADNFTDYKIFTIADLPKIEVALVESIDPHAPYGAKGIGENGMNCVAGAIANAVSNALENEHMPDIPMTAERIMKILE